ncbi:D-aminoacyl-tRNA deacylase [Actinoplanes capillaceus]|uniref:D-aminoacyl-tRNA deacylase n=2 Tax=Actinoplanes campanulatus TaxID=113559 RepID=A0ABQ3WB91_9ACTN|nr:D-aminoacyl-tRNA deacylase [Actinoplanes capillaceus]
MASAGTGRENVTPIMMAGRVPVPSTIMRAVVQTVSRASVTVGDEVVGKIADGLLVLVGVTHDDTPAKAAELARKTWELRVLDDRSAADHNAPILVVSQFTLYGDARKGRRPSWSAAAPAETAEPLVEEYVKTLRARGATVETGRFRAHMLVESVNVGPCTVLLEL